MDSWLARNSYTMEHIMNTFKAFVEIIIPLTPNLAARYGEIQYYGAIDLLTYEYLIQSLHQYGGMTMVIETTRRLDYAATKLMLSEMSNGGNQNNRILFKDLVPEDRVTAISLLEGEETDMMEGEYANINFLIRHTMMGYYSEWYGYGLTRLENPNDRVLEFLPLSWQQIEYPGPGRVASMRRMEN